MRGAKVTPDQLRCRSSYWRAISITAAMPYHCEMADRILNSSCHLVTLSSCQEGHVQAHHHPGSGLCTAALAHAWAQPPGVGLRAAAADRRDDRAVESLV